jgi:type IV pilus assembly protein PilB
MKVDSFLITASVNLMVGQRLLPKICQQCKQEKQLTSDLQKELEEVIEGISQEDRKNFEISPPYKVYESKGCDACKGKGVSGRIAIFEILQMTPELAEIISKKGGELDILKEAKRQGMITLRQDGVIKALKGLVSLETVLRETEQM